MQKDAVAIAFLAGLFALSGAARAEDVQEGNKRDKTPTIQVVGTGTVQVKPDIATLTIGVSTEDGNAQNAVSRNTAATARVISELEAAAIAKKDVLTSKFSIYPQSRTEGADKHQVTTYRVSNVVTVIIRDLDKVGDILTKVVAAGSNQINGPNLSLSDPEKYLTEARKKAVENALTKAQTYATAAGLKLGSIREIVEEGTAAPVYAARFAGLAKSAAPVPIEAGEESLQAQVLLVIELKP
jgi:uncharacterized protein